MLNLRTERDKSREALAQDRLQAAFENRMIRLLMREYSRASRAAAAMWRKSMGDSIPTLETIEHHQINVMRILRSTYEPVIRSINARFIESFNGGKAFRSGHGATRYPDEAGIWFNQADWYKDMQGEVDKLVEQYLIVFALERSVLIANTSAEVLREIIIQAAAEGIGPVETARQLDRALGGVLGRARAQMTARTEIHSAAMDSSIVTANSTNLTLLKEWVPVEDDRTRQSHRDMRGHPNIPLDRDFNVGGSPMAFPGDPKGPAKEVINCRCILVYEEAVQNDA